MGAKTALSIAQAFWAGDRAPLLHAPIFDLLESGEAIFPYIVVDFLLWTGDFHRSLELMAEMPELNSLEVAEYWIMLARGYAHQRAGNAALAQSYLKAALDEMEDSVRSQWAQEYEPDIFYSQKAICYALLEDEGSAREAIQMALDSANIIRHYSDYFNALNRCAQAYALLGEVEKASELIDQVLSNPSYFTAGRILIDPFLESLHEETAFRAVIRKHADQLEDPAILNEYFQ